LERDRTGRRLASVAKTLDWSVPSLPSDLDAIATELVVLYRQAARNAPADAARSAALSLGRALAAIQRVKRSSHPDSAYALAMSDVAEARSALAQFGIVDPAGGGTSHSPRP
jgi:hypothetical protein